jgi:hypothetical protein
MGNANKESANADDRAAPSFERRGPMSANADDLRDGTIPQALQHALAGPSGARRPDEPGHLRRTLDRLGGAW